MPTLAELGLASSATADPLSYPGEVAGWSGLLVGDSFVELRAVPGRPVGSYEVGVGNSPTLDAALAALGTTGVDDRHPLLAVGSNAAPGQIRSKFDRFDLGTGSALPMLRGTVAGWRRTILAHVSVPGYVPITVERHATAGSMPVTLLLCDDAQLRAIDATEPNYRRSVGRAAEPLTLENGEQLCGYVVYVGRRGPVLGTDGAAVEFTTQFEAITLVMSKLSDELRTECGADVASFVAAAAADRTLRERIADHIASVDPIPTEHDKEPEADAIVDPPTYTQLRRRT